MKLYEEYFIRLNVAWVLDSTSLTELKKRIIKSRVLVRLIEDSYNPDDDDDDEVRYHCCAGSPALAYNLDLKASADSKCRRHPKLAWIALYINNVEEA